MLSQTICEPEPDHLSLSSYKHRDKRSIAHRNIETDISFTSCIQKTANTKLPNQEDETEVFIPVIVSPEVMLISRRRRKQNLDNDKREQKICGETKRQRSKKCKFMLYKWYIITKLFQAMENRSERW
ncbi:hypothetical protein EYC84_003440 [Monilinia fructicola]|uniref:Uncharacterized protein n=1 Tax=Monilinia fructicola TaxID=38448 RepID=A0A5M9K1T9_MONFR|nr:hypothetical protein EYC84_003440 [Monilinia fructicola]